MDHRFARNRWWFILLSFTTVVVLSRVSAFLLRFDFEIPSKNVVQMLVAVLLDLPVKLAIFYTALLHRGWSSQLGIPDLKRIATGTLIASGCTAGLLYTICGPTFPRSVFIIDALVMFLTISALRVIVRLSIDARKHRQKSKARPNLLIYGAGRAAAALIREIGENPEISYRVVGIIDDDPLKEKETVLGVRVLGTGADLPAIIAQFLRRDIRIEHILIAIPSASGEQMRNAVALCRNSGLICKTLPGIDDLLDSKGLTAQIRDIALEDLLGREPIVLDGTQIRAMIEGTRVLITGAAGSIGSELCRQVAAYIPGQLVLLDQSESDLFRIDMQIRDNFPDLAVMAELADIRCRSRIEEVIRNHRIEVIFHAAAYKHVPMMERHAVEGAVNNVLGTWNLCSAAVDNGVKSFVMISSDKAVRPTNVMGATKRAAELVVSSFASDGETKFVSVRFGNVLGSNGSVVPIFKAQIAAGGPVKVTHPEVRRYFMTIREAVQLVLQASAMGKDSEVYVLDMGQPVRIVDLARNMIRLAGFIPDKDIAVSFSGLRPGEKLYEELITEGENILPTYHRKIKIFQAPPPHRPDIENWVDGLRSLVQQNDGAGVVAHLARLIPEYTISDTWLDNAAAASPKLPAVAVGPEDRKSFRVAV